MEEKFFEESEVIDEIKEPDMYKVILLNDDYTTMDFVVHVLVTIFNKPVAEATRIMLDVHEKGKGIVGIYTYDIAITKISRTHALAKANEFPLKAVMEKA